MSIFGDMNLEAKEYSAITPGKVMTLNGNPLPRTLNKSDDFYDGYQEGFRRAVAMIEGRPSIKSIRMANRGGI